MKNPNQIDLEDSINEINYERIYLTKKQINKLEVWTENYDIAILASMINNCEKGKYINKKDLNEQLNNLLNKLK